MNTNLNVEKVLEDSKNVNMRYIDNLATKELSAAEFISRMEKTYSEFVENYEPIFKMSISQSYDYNRLKYMLELAKQVQKEEITEHSASVKVGQILVDEIVKPQLDKAGVKSNKK